MVHLKRYECYDFTSSDKSNCEHFETIQTILILIIILLKSSLMHSVCIYTMYIQD